MTKKKFLWYLGYSRDLKQAKEKKWMPEGSQLFIDF